MCSLIVFSQLALNCAQLTTISDSKHDELNHLLNELEAKQRELPGKWIKALEEAEQNLETSETMKKSRNSSQNTSKTS
jgi:hypothetical protein